MLYPPAFFGLQLNFASKLTQHPYQEIILNMTALYRILGLIGALMHRIPPGRITSRDCMRAIPAPILTGVINTCFLS